MSRRTTPQLPQVPQGWSIICMVGWEREGAHGSGYEGEEYESLLRYVEDQAKVLKDKENRGDDQGDDEAHYTRHWYSPWKKTKVESVNKTIPNEWLNTDRTKGISASEADNRRKTTGYNELES